MKANHGKCHLLMKANHDKCYLLMSTLTPISIKVKDYIIKNSDNEKLLGAIVDANLKNFNCHLENILKKASKKVHVLARITPYMSIPNRKLLMNFFFLQNLIIAHLFGCAIAVQ